MSRSIIAGTDGGGVGVSIYVVAIGSGVARSSPGHTVYIVALHK